MTHAVLELILSPDITDYFSGCANFQLSLAKRQKNKGNSRPSVSHKLPQPLSQSPGHLWTSLGLESTCYGTPMGHCSRSVQQGFYAFENSHSLPVCSWQCL